MGEPNRYARAREQAGLSIGQAARILGSTVGAVKLVERTQAPYLALTNDRLADVYGCSVEWLTGQVPYLDVAAIDRIPGGRDLPYRDREALAELLGSLRRTV